MKNNRGILGIFEGAIGPVVAGYYGYALVLIGLAIATTPSHIIKKAQEKCVYQGDSLDSCKNIVGTMSVEDRKNYIRDTESNPAPYDPNYGVHQGLKI